MLSKLSARDGLDLRESCGWGKIFNDKTRNLDRKSEGIGRELECREREKSRAEMCEINEKAEEREEVPQLGGETKASIVGKVAELAGGPWCAQAHLILFS